jgi:hypothetical protein
VVAGPILFIAYRQHGADFAAGAAKSSLLGLVARATFAVVFARAAGRFGWLGATATSCAAVLAVDTVLSTAHVTTPVALGCTLTATTAAALLLPSTGAAPREPDRPPPWDLPGRAAATAVLVLTVTTAAGVLGPQWTGLLAPLPIATGVVAAFAHARHGAAVTARTMAGVVTGLYGFALFCLLVAVLVRPLGSAAFPLGAVTAVAVQLVVARLRKAVGARRRPVTVDGGAAPRR